MQHSRFNVLVVDDNRDSADSFAVLLRIKGHDAEVAYDADTALLLAKNRIFDMMFLDLAMPKTDGLQLAEQMRNECQSRNAMLIALTGCTGDQDRLCAKNAGFDSYFLKPIDPREVDKLFEHMPRK